MIRLAAFDVDGTLREREYMPESTKQALRKLKDNGVQLALCTGRSEYEMASLREELGIDWAITCNGSHIGHQGRTVFGTPFPKETIRLWLEEADRLGHTFLLYGSEKLLMNREDDPHFRQAQQEIGFMEPVILNRGEEAPDIYQCIVFCDEEHERRYTAEERELYYIHRWRTWAVDINPMGTNKAVGLRRLMDHLGFAPEEVAAFGDGGNDLEMLESVGLGIAMGNGPDEVKARAKHVTKPMREDGIAYAVDKWLL